MTVLPDLAITALQACNDYIVAYCQKLESCAPLLITTQFGDVTTCTTRLQLVCALGTTPTGAGPMPTAIETCVADLTSTSCDDVFAAVLPASCASATGTKMNGTGCGDASECQSGFCGKPDNMACGTCGPKPTTGSDCSHIPCGDGFVCSAANLCVAKGLVSASCQTDSDCIASLSCEGAHGTTSGTCQRRLTAGVTCDSTTQTTPGCDTLNGLFCNPATKVCQTLGLAGAGQVCGINNGGYSVCTASAYCRTSGLSGTCVATAADGAACNATNGPMCLPPANCVNGVCVLPAVPSCP